MPLLQDYGKYTVSNTDMLAWDRDRYYVCWKEAQACAKLERQSCKAGRGESVSIGAKMNEFAIWDTVTKNITVEICKVFMKKQNKGIIMATRVYNIE